MKKLLFITMFASSVFAEPITIKKPVVCDKTEAVLKVLISDNYKEKPIWLGASEEKLVNYSLWVNATNKSWTIIQFNNDFACVIGAGEAYTTLGKKPIL